MKVKELMNPHVWTVRERAPLTEVLRLLWDEDVGCLPVVDEWNHVVGMVTDRDVAMCGYLRGRPIAQLAVEECMSRHVYACRADDEVEVAAGAMRLHQVRRLPVLDESDRLMGVLSIHDLARVACTHPKTTTRRELADELARTLGAVAEPRRRQAEEEALVELTPAAGPPEARTGPPRATAKAR